MGVDVVVVGCRLSLSLVGCRLQVVPRPSLFQDWRPACAPSCSLVFNFLPFSSVSALAFVLPLARTDDWELPLIVSVWASPLLVLIKCETIKAAAAAVYVVNRVGVTKGGVDGVVKGGGARPQNSCSG